MAKPTRLQKQRLGPLVAPFERQNRNNQGAKKEIGIWEDELFIHATYNATEDGKPDGVHLTNLIDRSRDNKYIWAITPTGLFITYENTSPSPELHPDLTRMRHTNLTGGKKAYQGGELWFLQNDSVVINFRSGRYGAENEFQKKAVIEYFQFVGCQYVDVREERV